MPEINLIKEWHATACATMRRLDRTADDVTCTHCRKPRKDHLENVRCNIYCTTTFYSPSNADERSKISQTIILLEALASVWRWQL